ncbi:glycine/sarcosine/betaine reductase component B subunit, partial [uncultured Cetobacterium sp.]|uniref:glycine/sarcosine/betaine reductase component B subunit n=1 Tax=uncultured Cetobacterium sp. TaxID=527638 RepID=UPI0026033BA9
MKLTMGNIQINDIVFGEKLKVSDKVLYVNPQELIDFLKEDKNIKDIKINIAKPGDKTRIIPVKDAIEPRVRLKGEMCNFPGVTGKIFQTGNESINILKGAAIITIGDIVGFQEGVIDMWGEGAKWTPFSKTFNLVVDIKPIEGLEPHTHEKTVRLAGLRASEFIGQAGKDLKPDDIEIYETESISKEILKNKDLPKVVYVEMLISQGLLHDTYIYGVNSQLILPTLLHPNEELDGAVIS